MRPNRGRNAEWRKRLIKAIAAKLKERTGFVPYDQQVIDMGLEMAADHFGVDTGLDSEYPLDRGDG